MWHHAGQPTAAADARSLGVLDEERGRDGLVTEHSDAEARRERLYGEATNMRATKSQGKAKSLKPLATKKAPEPTNSHAPIDDWLRRVMPDLHPVVKAIDELICKAIPGLHYAIKWKKAYYGLPDHGWIIELVAYDVSANIVFFGGAEFDSPPPLGSVGKSRYVKLNSVEQVREPSIRKWIEQARRVRGWK